ncbi:hypothetical protein GCM10027028_48450 [Streptomyces sundarbansensis]
MLRAAGLLAGLGGGAGKNRVGIHTRGAFSCSGPGSQVIHSERAGEHRPRTQKGPLAFMAAQRSLSSATGVGTPYDTTRQDMKGLERWITGPDGTRLPYSKVSGCFMALTRR